MKHRLGKLRRGVRGLAAFWNSDRGALARSVVSFGLNLLFLLFNLVMAFRLGTPWYSCLIVYYLLLAATRYLILFRVLPAPKQYRVCGSLLLCLAFGLCAIIFQFVSGAKEYHYPAVVLYVLAVYTFGNLFGALKGFAKPGRGQDARMLGKIRLISAAVSYLSLQYMILEAYASHVDAKWFSGIAGGAVFLIVLSVAVTMLAKGRRA